MSLRWGHYMVDRSQEQGWGHLQEESLTSQTFPSSQGTFLITAIPNLSMASSHLRMRERQVWCINSMKCHHIWEMHDSVTYQLILCKRVLKLTVARESDVQYAQYWDKTWTEITWDFYLMYISLQAVTKSGTGIWENGGKIGIGDIKHGRH